MTASEEKRSLDAQIRALGSNIEAFRALFDNMDKSAGFLKMLFDENGRPYDLLVMRVNPAFERRSGLKAEQVVGRRSSELAPDGEPVWLEKFGQAVLEQRAIVVEGRSKLFGQSLRVEAVPMPVKDLFAVMLHDATDGRTERDLQENEERRLYLQDINDALSPNEEPVQALMRITAILAMRLDVCRVLYLVLDDHDVEDAFGVIVASYERDLPPMSGKIRLSDLGLGPSERQRVSMTIAPFDRADEADAGRRPSDVSARLSVPIIRQGRLVAVLVVHRRQPLNWTPYEADIARETAERAWDAYEQASALQALIDAKEMLKKTVEERTRELREIEARFHILVGTTNDGFWWTDARGRIIGASQGMVDLLKYSVDELVGSHWSEYVDKGCMDEAFKRWEDQISGESIRFDLLVRRRDGGQAWIQVNSSPMTDEQGRFTGTLGAFTNINERKRAEEELKRSNEELQQFAYVASHDLREPLRMVSSYLELLERRYSDKTLDEKAKQYIHFAVDGALRMQQMIDDILTYSRLDTRGKPFAPVDMNTALATAMSDLEAAIKESGAEIVHDALPTVEADDNQMVILLENLLSNAIKFRGDKAPKIVISARLTAGEWTLSVSDNGIGIDPSQAGRLFQMFVRLHAGTEYGGTGIGLAICKKIVERHGGRIWVLSEPGKGSTFRFTLPERGYDEMR